MCNVRRKIVGGLVAVLRSDFRTNDYVIEIKMVTDPFKVPTFNQQLIWLPTVSKICLNVDNLISKY